MKTLLICKTTYQCKLAVLVLKELEVFNYDILSIYDTGRYEDSYESIQLRENAENSFDFKTSDYIFLFRDMIAVSTVKKMVGYDRVIVSSIDNLAIQLVLSLNEAAELLTFDDGSANFVQNSMFYIDRQSLLKKIIYQTLGNKYNLKSIKERVLAHYSTRELPNIVSPSRVKVLNFKENQLETCEVERIKNIVPVVLIGSNFDELLNTPEKLISIITKHMIGSDCYYIPHPRNINHYRLNDSFIMFDSSITAEDKIISMLGEYERVKIIGFPSSVFINLSKNKRVEKVIFNSNGFSKSLDAVTQSIIELVEKDIDEIIYIDSV
ncbi:glycosyltransferase family 52 protein [Enterovibrio sp. ZSDZ42]|uniref:Glycosyltransferase family 52 protein n=1 Tax=Enterovibrio gelatinilyticus TaxID=2899819 RepID=A0ABT5R701_9GAMM|nr:glycosyltransferase family 52 [Enterovibrio sp. ZSDZ42]MDD1796036.1 glycosyltransferase family 52 protein [Enterovibrio sp. ZSDZ42]